MKGKNYTDNTEQCQQSEIYGGAQIWKIDSGWERIYVKNVELKLNLKIFNNYRLG